MGQVLHGERHDDRGGPSSDTALSTELEVAGEALRRQPEDHRKVEGANLRFRFADGAEGDEVDGLVG
jgi:hypothetical protein